LEFCNKDVLKKGMSTILKDKRLFLSLSTHAYFQSTLIVSLGLEPQSAAATVLACTRYTIISFHTTCGRYSTKSWPEIGLSNTEASLKKQSYQRFFWAGRKTSKLKADKRRCDTFDNTWAKTTEQLGILQTDWENNRLTWTWNFE